MYFGSVPVDDALGAILAHSIQLGGTRLRKGVELTPGHIAAMKAAGEVCVVVARLDADDLHENEAADAIARAVVPDPVTAGIEVSDSFTGRVNLYSAIRGVVELDVAKLHALNLIDPMITLATVPPLTRVIPRTMVGTVKIISYGVAGQAVAAAARAAAAAIRVLPVLYSSATLIVTHTGAETEARPKAVYARLAALGITAVETLDARHDTGAVAAAIGRATGELVLILTASATSDPFDVGPQALRDAGGQVTRFGMPVDPGNLLFFGNLGGKPVIGLPGCARSPALNGADWVLERIACGVTVTAQDIAEMGVGGLLKEIPTRPQPRDG